MSKRPRQNYQGVVAAAPVTIPYERFSIHGAHWWIGRALRALSEQARLKPSDIDGFSVSSFTPALRIHSFIMGP